MTTRWLSEGNLNVTYLNMRGWAYYNVDSLQKALHDYDLAVEIDKTNAELYFRRADILFDLAKYKESIDDYTNAIELLPDSLTYFVSRGVAYEKAKKFNRALQDYNYVLLKDSNNELALRNRAILYSFQFNDSARSFIDWNKLLSFKSQHDYFFDRSLSYLHFKNFHKAISDLNLALGYDSEEKYKYYAYRGYSYGMMDRIDQAMNDFAKSQTIKPGNEYLFRFRGEVYLKANMKDKACDDFRKAIQQNPLLTYLVKKCK